MSFVSVLEFAHAKVLVAMSILRAYLDETGDYADQKCNFFGVLGLIGPVHSWHKLQGQWEDALECCGVDNFHATDLAAFQGAYDGWSNHQREKLLASLVEAVQKDFSSFRLIGSVVVLSDFDRLPQHRRSDLKDLYRVCSMWAMLQGIWRSEEVFEKQPVEFVFSQRLKQAHALDSSYDYLQADYPSLCLGLTKASPLLVSPLQVADLVAYESYKFLNGRLDGRKPDDVRWPVLQLEELFYKSKAALFDYDNLMLVSDVWGNYAKAKELLGIRQV